MIPTSGSVEGYQPGTESLSGFARLWDYRGFLGRLVVRNLQVKFQRSFFGFFWTLLNPMLTVAILTAVFSRVVRIPIDGYWAFLLSGYFVWNFVIQTLNTGTYIVPEHARLLRSAAFPSELLVLGAALSKMVEFCGAMLLSILAIVIFFHQGIPSSLVLVPFLAVLQFILVAGLMFPIATLAAFYYDVQHVLPIALTTLFYVSPVFYPAWMVPEGFRDIYMLTPIAPLLTLYQQDLYEGTFPTWAELGRFSLLSIAVFALGYWIFRRFSGVYAEVI